MATATQTTNVSDSGVRLFDRTRLFHLKTIHPDFENGKWSTVRFPTDAEWCQRSRQQITVQKSVGRDSTRQEIPKLVEISAALFDKIDQKAADDQPLDDVEKMRIIERLERCTVIQVDKVAGKYQIRMKVLGGVEVMHELSIPSQKQIMDFGKAAVTIDNRRLVRETKVALEPSGELWRRLVAGFTGYDDAERRPVDLDTASALVPIIHMDAALTELLQQIHAEVESQDDDPED